ncbi:MAG: hypothetical protein ACFFER_18415 [Candidatus Thorarchaeota archaeon]
MIRQHQQNSEEGLCDEQRKKRTHTLQIFGGFNLTEEVLIEFEYEYRRYAAFRPIDPRRDRKKRSA